MFFGEKLMTRWRTLRDKFYKDMKKKPSRSCVDSPHKNKKWLDSLMFLKDVEMDNMNTQSNYGQEIVEGDDFFLSDFGESACSTITLEPVSHTAPWVTGKKNKN
uniref:Coiled-coil domain-containing protein 38 n=1 Tax=Zeugodacus cucurbitae TaxID=28588 RepID=A0A0A1WJB9_ZEUCU